MIQISLGTARAYGSPRLFEVRLAVTLHNAGTVYNLPQGIPDIYGYE